MPDIAINAQAVIAAGTGYTVPGSQEILVKSIRASYNGAGAVGSFRPVLQVIDPGGVVVAECDIGTTLAAGASADCSWFPGVRQAGGGTLETTNPAGSPLVSPTTELEFGSGFVLSNPSAGLAEVVAANPVNPGGTVLVYDYTVTGASKASIDTNVDGPYAGLFRTDLTALEGWFTSRTDEAVLLSQVDLTLNNDAGANYDRAFVATSIASNAAVTDSGGQTGLSFQPFVVPGSSMAANVSSYMRFTVPNYANTVFYKAIEATFGCVDTVAGLTHRQDLVEIFQYRSTAAVTRVAVTPDTAGKKFLVGTRLTIWGR